MPTEPYLNAQQANYLTEQIHAFKTGKRKNPVMQALVANLNDEQISELATYFSAQAPISAEK